MKKIKLLGILVLSSLIVFMSCEDDDNGLNVQDNEDNEFVMIMDSMLSEMKAMEMTGDADYDFASMMMMHHDGAIEMSQKLLDMGGEDTLEAMAQKIITEQQSEKADLMEFVESHTPVPTPEGQLFGEESMVNTEKLDKAKDIEILIGEINYDYAKMIILHHQGAIDMAQSVIHHGSDEMIIEMAKKTVEDQNNEILQLQNWLLNNQPYK